jgi:hypothetical protein
MPAFDEKVLQQLAAGDNVDLEMWAQRFVLFQRTLTTMAMKADVVLTAGRACSIGCSEGLEQLQLACDLHRPLSRLRRMAKLSELYGQTSVGELSCAAFLAAARGDIDLATAGAVIESEPRVVALLAPAKPLARSLLNVRHMVANGEPPEEDFAAFYVAPHWGRIIEKRTYSAIANHLALAFTQWQLGVLKAEQIICKLGFHEFTPSGARWAARAAIQEAAAACAARAANADKDHEVAAGESWCGHA